MFIYGGKPIDFIRRVFAMVCQRVDITGAVFHELRHTFVMNMRWTGVDSFRIMAITGHQTMEVCKRYHTIDHDDLTHAVTQLDAYMDTMAASAAEGHLTY